MMTRGAQQCLEADLLTSTVGGMAHPGELSTPRSTVLHGEVIGVLWAASSSTTVLYWEMWAGRLADGPTPGQSLIWTQPRSYFDTDFMP